ncbi:hypothetical protein B0H11DRAFT_1931392 [Mycena galericulata]|nr:hypothetical protein B0H11DRAFT_1931392 [Mycena galericulata]
MARDIMKFPLMCNDENPPKPVGSIDERGLKTPPYAYGWIAPYQKLLDAAEDVMGEVPETLQIPFVWTRWNALGHADTYGSGMRPELRGLRDKRTEAVLVYIATNDSIDMIKLATSDRAFRDACKESLGNPKLLHRGAMWFRVDMEVVPENYDYEFGGYRTTRHYHP